jgi:hypothetical protein
MGRSTFEGPILAADQRFGPQRDAGTVQLVQRVYMDFSQSTPGQANYGGSSGQFVTSNNIPNSQATIWVPQNGTYSANGPTIASAPTADTTTTAYRGASFLLPQQSTLIDVIFDVVAVPVDSGTNTVTAIHPYVSNNFTSSLGVYGTFANQSSPAVGRFNATYSTSQYGNAQATLQDVQNLQPGQQPTWFSQVVVSVAFTTVAAGLASGVIAITLRYTQADLNIGNSTTYPYGNFD